MDGLKLFGQRQVGNEMGTCRRSIGYRLDDLAHRNIGQGFNRGDRLSRAAGTKDLSR